MFQKGKMYLLRSPVQVSRFSLQTFRARAPAKLLRALGTLMGGNSHGALGGILWERWVPLDATGMIDVTTLVDVGRGANI